MPYIFFALLIALSAPVEASTYPLDRPYKNLVHPNRDMTLFSQRELNIPAKSDINSMLNHITPVRNQDDRGTCSIFSATALVESLMVLTGKADHNVDMSEEWLQYLTTLKVSEEGSDTPANFKLLKEFGQPTEAEMPYIGKAWTSKRSGLAQKRCGHLSRGKDLKSCLISHRDPNLIQMSDADLLNPISHFYDPEFVKARGSAIRHKKFLFEGTQAEGGLVTSVNEIHRLLAQGIPLTMEFDFYYGSWNDPDATKYGIHRSAKLWRQGAVTYPEKDSMDLKSSKIADAGHSVLAVGYDDHREITYWVNMKDGSKKKITRRGVYYFKNSWGQSRGREWGSEFEIDGVRYPGYGMILQDHAHDFGQFFRLVLR